MFKARKSIVAATTALAVSFAGVSAASAEDLNDADDIATSVEGSAELSSEFDVEKLEVISEVVKEVTKILNNIFSIVNRFGGSSN